MKWRSTEMEQAHVDKGLSSNSGCRRSHFLLLTDSFLPHAGGSRVYYYNLYKHMTDQFPDRVTVLTKKVPGWQSFDALASSESLRIVRRSRPLPNWKYHQIPKVVSPLWHSWRFARQHKVDLIHAGDLFPPGLIAMWHKQITGTPYLAYCHGEEITQTDLRRYQPRVRNAIYSCADGVIAANEFARANLLRIGVAEDKIFKILPGVDREKFVPQRPNPELITRYGLAGKKIILSVGRLVARKGHTRLLQALNQIRDRVPQFHYLIAGEGPEKQAILSLAAQLGLSPQVTLVGKLTDEQLPDFYNACDVFALVNHVVEGDLEGFGMVFVEANACGKPVIGGRSGGTAEAVVDGKTGFLVDPENYEEIAARLLLLLQNDELSQRMGAAGLERARTEFNWGTRAQAFREINQEIVMRKHRQARTQQPSLDSSA